MRPLELYLHIPFCVQKCKYCDFLSAPAPAGERREYVESLCRQIRKYHELAKAYHVVSIFIGGGTPSLLESCQMERIAEAVRETFLLEEERVVISHPEPAPPFGGAGAMFKRVRVRCSR